MRRWKDLTGTEKRFAWVALVFLIVAVGATIGWLNSYVPMAKDWAVISGAATAVGTFVLAFFAFWAWQASLEALKVTKELTTSDLRQRQVAREVDALADYLRDLSTVSTIPHYPSLVLPAVSKGMDTFEELDAYRDFLSRDVIAPIRRSGMIWRLQHHAIQHELFAMRQAESRLIASIEKLQALDDIGRFKAINAKLENFVRVFSQALSDWQMMKLPRPELSEAVEILTSGLDTYFDTAIKNLFLDDASREVAANEDAT